MNNRVIHFEIHAADTAKVAEFYKNVFGWEIRKWDPPSPKASGGQAIPVVDYWIVMTAPEGSAEPGINGGIVGRQGPTPKGGEPVTSFVCTIGVPSILKKLRGQEERLLFPRWRFRDSRGLRIVKILRETSLVFTRIIKRRGESRNILRFCLL